MSYKQTIKKRSNIPSDPNSSLYEQSQALSCSHRFVGGGNRDWSQAFLGWAHFSCSTKYLLLPLSTAIWGWKGFWGTRLAADRGVIRQHIRHGQSQITAYSPSTICSSITRIANRLVAVILRITVITPQWISASSSVSRFDDILAYYRICLAGTGLWNAATQIHPSLSFEILFLNSANHALVLTGSDYFYLCCQSFVSVL